MSIFRLLLISSATAISIFNGAGLMAQNNSRDFGALDFAPLTFGDTRASDAVDVSLRAELRRLNDLTVELLVTMELPDGYYTYSMDKSFSASTEISLKELGGLAWDGNWTADREPKKAFDEILERDVEKYFRSVTWRSTLRGEIRGDLRIEGQLSGQYCGSGENGVPGECRPIRRRPFTATLTSTESSSSESAETPANVPPDRQASPSENTRTPRNSGNNPVRVSPTLGFGRGARTGLVDFEFELTPHDAVPGQEVLFTIRARISEPWHTFALDQNPEMAGLPTTITIDPDAGDIAGLEPVGDVFLPLSTPVEEQQGDFLQRVHYGEIAWTRSYVVTGSQVRLKGVVGFQLCKDGQCLPPGKAPFEVTMTIPAGSAGSDAIASTTRTAAGLPGRSADGVSGGAQSSGLGEEGLLAFILSAIGAGFVALLTPCVFPMIPVTVAFFLKQEEKKSGSSLRLAIVYCLSIVGAFTVLGLLVSIVFGPVALNQWANNGWLNLGFAALFVLFGVGLLGLFDVQVPHWVLNWSAKRESTGGVIGIVFMALTFTLVSFTCTFAFVGSLLVAATRGDFFWPAIGMLAFSSAFASPFFVLAMFPRMLKSLPKSGGWMNDVKVVIGLVEIAAAIKFLSVADIAFSKNQTPVFITWNVFLWTWIILSATAGFFLIGVFRGQRPRFSKVRYVTATLFLVFAARLAAGLMNLSLPSDPAWNLVAAFAPPNVEASPVTETADRGYVIAHHDLEFYLEYDRAVKAALASGQPLFIDFTGVNCVNCRQMERTVMVDSRVVAAMKKMVRAQLYTDLIPGVSDEELRTRLLLLNQELQSELTGDVALPSYAVVSGDGKTVLAYFSGLDQSGGTRFLEFLNAGLSRWEATEARGSADTQRPATDDMAMGQPAGQQN